MNKQKQLEQTWFPIAILHGRENLGYLTQCGTTVYKSNFLKIKAHTRNTARPSHALTVCIY